MKILHISNDFSLTRVHRNLYDSLDKLGIEQNVFNPVRKGTPIGNNNIHFNTSKSFICYSKQIKKFHRYLFRNKVNYLYKDLLSKVDIKSIDIIHATTLFSDGAIAYKLKQQFSIPFVVAIRSTDIDVFLKYRLDLIPLCRKILLNASKIIFIGDSLKERFLSKVAVADLSDVIERKAHVIYNGIDDFWLNNITQKKLVVPTKVLFVGRFIPRKNAVLLLKSILELNTHGYNLELNLVGSGGSDEKLLKELQSLYPDTIKILGKINNKQDLIQIYRENHIFAMPSKGETFGLVYIEALSQGLPLIYSQNEGIDGVFNFEIGEKPLSYEISEFVNCIKKVIDNYSNYELHKIDFSNFRWNNIAVKYFKLYESICKN